MSDNVVLDCETKLRLCCNHDTLHFASGDYYIFCNKCGARWGMLGDHPEHGWDSTGNKIGTDPSRAGRYSEISALIKPRHLITLG